MDSRVTAGAAGILSCDTIINIPSSLAPLDAATSGSALPRAGACDQTCLYECQASQSGECTVVCETACQYGQSCSSCESCQTICEKGCQEKCELACQIQQSGLDVALWSWTSSNGAASAAQTRNAYSVLEGSLPTENFSYKVWNDIVDKASEVRSAKGYTWDTVSGKYFSVSGCKVSQGDSLTAKKYNSVRYNIGSMKGTGITDRSRGDVIYGTYIVTLTDVLNDIINGL